MKESYNEGLASHIGPESCLDDPRGRWEALTGESTGGLLSSEITNFRRRRIFGTGNTYNRFPRCAMSDQPEAGIGMPWTIDMLKRAGFVSRLKITSGLQRR